MRIEEALKHVNSAITELEKEIYNFQNVAIPRYEKDKEILNKMRDDFIKIESIKLKHEKGEDVTTEELSAIPEAFR